MDIGSKNDYPSCALSNFAAHEFYIDGVRCASMEGFLQSLDRMLENGELDDYYNIKSVPHVLDDDLKFG